MKSVLALSFLSLLSSGTAANAADWSIRMFNVDDRIDVLVNGALARTCAFSRTCDYSIDAFMRTGRNKITVRVVNISLGAGWSYGYVLRRNNDIIAQDVCGYFNVTGCQNDSIVQGTAYEVNYYVNY